MPQILRDLEIEEVSLVDAPACSEIDPRTRARVKRATVALFKRDSNSSANDKIEQEKPMGLKTILKSATRTREQIADAVERKATKIAKRQRIGMDAARARAWRDHPEAQLAYEQTQKAAPKRTDKRTFQCTQAEADLDDRARKRMRKTGETYARAVSKELEADPGLYDRYQKELEAGKTYLVIEPEDMRGQAGEAERMYMQKADDGDECPECEEEVEASDKFCRSCGADLAKRKRQRQPARA
jgi:hypothetical protein